MSNTRVVREHDDLTAERIGLSQDELKDLKEFALEHQRDDLGNYRPVLTVRNGKLIAGNYVGIVETRKGTVLEILPKVDFAEGESENTVKKTKEVFFKMLRTWRGFKSQAVFNASQINAVRRFNMLEVFVHLFLNNLVRLTQRGLARHYQAVKRTTCPASAGAFCSLRNIFVKMHPIARVFTSATTSSAPIDPPID